MGWPQACARAGQFSPVTTSVSQPVEGTWQEVRAWPNVAQSGTLGVFPGPPSIDCLEETKSSAFTLRASESVLLFEKLSCLSSAFHLPAQSFS